MIKNTLKQSGWFYLWVVLSIVSLWITANNRFEYFESHNLKLLSQMRQSETLDPHIIRLVIEQQSSDDIAFYQSLKKQFPVATVILANDLAQRTQLMINHQVDLSDRVIALSKNTITSDPLTQADLVSQFLPTANSSLSWSTLANLELAVQSVPSLNSTSAVFRKDDKIYPGLLVAALIKYHNGSAKLSQNLTHLTLQFDSQRTQLSQLNLGLTGRLISFEKNAPLFGIEQLQAAIDAKFDGLLIVDDLSSSVGKNLYNALQGIQANDYLVDNLFCYLLMFLAWVVMSLIIFKFNVLTVARKILLVFASIISLLLIQIVLSKFSIWLPMTSILLFSICSIPLIFGVNKEMQQKQNIHSNINSAVIESALYLLRNQKAKTLLDLLSNCIPTKALIDVLVETAVEAETQRNTAVACQLYEWILTHDKNHSISKQRLAEINAADEPAELDQTLVIENGQQSVAKPTNTNGILAIKNFGRYQVEGIIGKGAMGMVFQGVDPKINRHVAIKTLQLNDELDDESLNERKQRFFREAETAGNLSHANIVTIYDVGEQKHPNSNQSLGYIAMDLLTGAPLSEFIKADKLLPPPLVYQLMIQMTDALDYAHRQKVIHRDIKPANIIFDDDLQRGTLTDFGIAYMSDHSKTKTGTIMGSPYYMSPEQVMGQTVDGRSDIFSLGVTFYQLLSGHLPFNGESIATVAFHITKTKHESVRNMNKKLYASSTRITNKAMQKDPVKRYQSMQEFRQALVNALKRDYKKSPL